MFDMNFPVAGITASVLLVPLVSFVISFFTSMGGVTGAFLLLPFQVSVLGFTSPSVSATNFLYNVVGTPGGILRFIREDRMVWPLAAVITIGTFPGVLLGYYLRVLYLPDPRAFKFFVGLVLAGIGLRLLFSLKTTEKARSGSGGSFSVTKVSFTWARISYLFCGRENSASVPALFTLSLAVGIIGGVYGIGGGAIIAPFCVSVMNLPVYTVAGAALFGTMVTSVAGIVFYSLVPLNGVTAPPDWALGILFGLGGLAGMYLGARVQKKMPEKVIKGMLAGVILGVAGRYILQFWL